MAVLFTFGDTLVDSKEVAEKTKSGAFKKFSNSVSKKKDAKINFRSGSLTSRDVEGKKGSFTPIGIGKPLSLEIMSFYTGDAPKKTIGGTKDLLIASGTKYIHLPGAKPRAINHVYKSVRSRHLYGPSAFQDGCPIIYYSPGIEADSIVTSIEIMASKFDKKGYGQVTKFLNKATAIPLFAPSASTLMLGSSIVNIAGKLGKTLFNSSKPYLKDDIIIEFNTPEVEASRSEFMVVVDGRYKNSILKSYKPVAVKRAHSSREVFLQHRTTGERYDGAAPYMIVSLDGRERTELDDFQPALASAAIMKEFYNDDNRAREATGILGDAMGLYNDAKFHNLAVEKKAKLKKMGASHKAYERELEKFRGLQKNIKSKKFKVNNSGLPKKK